MALCISSSTAAAAQDMVPYPSSSSSAPIASSSVAILSKCSICPDQKSTLSDLKLTVSGLPMLSCQYIQKGLFFPAPQVVPVHSVVGLLKKSLSRALSFFPPLAGRLYTDPDGAIYISCNDAGVEFSQAVAPALSIPNLLTKGGLLCCRGRRSANYYGCHRPDPAVADVMQEPSAYNFCADYYILCAYEVFKGRGNGKICFALFDSLFYVKGIVLCFALFDSL